MNNAPDSLHSLGLQRAAFLERLTAVLSADLRVEGAWLAGADGRNEADEWSDFDLNVAVRDSDLSGYLAAGPELYHTLGEPTLVQEEMPSENLNLGGAVYQLVYFEGGVMVDFNTGAATSARKPIGHLLLLERRPFEVVSLPPLTSEERHDQLQKWTTFFWAMAPIAIKYAARGSTRQAATQTDLLARALICLKRLLRDPYGPNPWRTWTNRPLEPEIDAELPRLGPVITPESVLDVINRQCGVMVGLHPMLEAAGLDVHPRMLPTTEAQLRLARQIVATASFPRRVYR